MKLNNNFFNKKAAMFGLDARIALAIFGALSVISGAALYSAIQNSKVIAFVTQMQEVAKSVEAYYLDVGENLPLQTLPANPSLLFEDLIVDNNKPNWQGPYLSGFKVMSTVMLQKNINNGPYNYFVLQCLDSFGEDLSSTVCPACNGADYCSYYLKVARADGARTGDIKFAEKIDNVLDNGDGLANGRFKITYQASTPTENIRMFYKLIPYK